MLPEFRTLRLILRPVQEKDLSSWYRNFNDYEVIRYLTRRVPWPYPEDGTINYWHSIKPDLGITRWHWGIFTQEAPSEMIGGIELLLEGNPENRGFWLARKHHKKGFMTEAVEPVNDFAFDVVGFDKLILGNAVGNLASRRIKEKMGAKLLRTEPFDFVDPALTESEFWELTKADWQAFKAASGAE